MRIGCDLGGTKIEAIALAADGAEVARRRVATPRGDYAATLAAIASLVAEVEAAAGWAAGAATVGVGMPGTFSAVTGRVKNANSTWLNGRALDADLADRLGRPVAFANDADCLALSEAVDGAGAGARVVFAVILGTGVGGGLAVDQRVTTGPNGTRGEWGHTPLPWPRADEVPGPACYCGARGCVETWLSGPAFARDADATSGQEAAEDPAALDRYVDRLARGLAVVVDIVDPDVVVLGGGVSLVEGLAGAVQERLPAYVFGGECRTPVRRSVHGDSSGVRGAAWLP